MRKIADCAVFFVLVLSIYSMADYVSCLPGGGGDISTSEPADITVTLDYADEKQQIKNFGASDCWTCQHIGTWSGDTKNTIADLLFETSLDADNNPKGIGLSLWRFNIGAGSSRQDNIRSRWRRTDTFLSEDFTGYDWSRCPGQRWFLQAAKDRGVEQFLAFCNSPSINMTKNGKAFCDSDVGSTNLADDKFDDFAGYLTDILEHFKKREGITFDYLSPFNEPQWDWEDNNQEGCRYSNKDIYRLVNKLQPEIRARGLNTELMIAEAGNIEYLYDESNDVAGNQIDSFFDNNSPLYLADKLNNQIDSHSYWTDTPERGLVPKRRKLKSKLDEYPVLEYHMSEYCHLNDLGRPRDLGMTPALQMGRVIHFDLTIAEAVSWQWWLGVSVGNYNDGLVYADRDMNSGDCYESKSLWVMGNFSRFLRPGMRRIGLSRSDNPLPEETQDDIMMSAYKNAEAGRVIVVVINRADREYVIGLECVNPAEGLVINSWIPYITDVDDDLTAYANTASESNIKIPPRSAVTLVSCEMGSGD